VATSDEFIEDRIYEWTGKHPKGTFNTPTWTGRILDRPVDTGGLHNREFTNIQRRIFHGLKNNEERLAFIDKVTRRKCDRRYPLRATL